MHWGHFVFYKINNRFRRQFNRIVNRYDDRNKGNYPILPRRIVYYVPDLQRTFTLYEQLLSQSK